MEKIKITEQMKELAENMAKTCLTNLKNVPNYTNLTRNNRYYTGFLGELIFREYLDTNLIPYKHFVELDGNSHNTDFLCYLPNTKRVDVKTASKNYYKYMMMPLGQYKKSNCDLYVGVKTDGDYGYILGYAEKKDFKVLNTPSLKVDTMGVLLDRLAELPTGHTASIKKKVE